MSKRIYIPLLSFALLMGMLAPSGAYAATERPECKLTVTTAVGTVELEGKKNKVLVQEGGLITIVWESENAKRAVDKSRDEIELTGTTTEVLDRNKSYSYRFNSGSRRVECAFSAVTAEGSFDQSSLVTNSPKPTISGEADGTKSVRLMIDGQGANSDVHFKSKTIRVKRGDWDAKITKSLPVGTYLVTLEGHKDLELGTLATGTLIVLGKGQTATTGGSLSVSPVPLLFGGNAAPGSSPAVAYIKVSNPGRSAASLSGFTLRQNGSAPTSAVIGFSTSDNLGGSRTTLGGTEGTRVFGSDGTAFVPLTAVIEPGQFRIFTLKAILSRSSGSWAGRNLMIDVASVNTTAATSGFFPMRGTTLTLTY